ncbi:MAG: hypothetical protein ACTTJC_05835 [Campylobacter sp.]
MRVALVNNSPAVSRLVTLSLDKMGYEYVEFQGLDELKTGFDILVLDGDVGVWDLNLKDYASRILFLSSKDSQPLSDADKTLQKPFLPTEFISVMESLSDIEPNIEDEPKINTQSFIDEPIEESADELKVNIGDSEESFEDLNIDTLQDLKIDDFDENDENLEQKSDTIGELSELMHEIDEMPNQDIEDILNDETSDELKMHKDTKQDILVDEMEQTDDIEDIDELLKAIEDPVEEFEPQEQEANQQVDEISIDDEVGHSDNQTQGQIQQVDDTDNQEQDYENVENSDNLDEEFQIDTNTNSHSEINEDIAGDLDTTNEDSNEMVENLSIDSVNETEISDLADNNEETTAQELVDDIDSLSERDLKMALDESVEDLDEVGEITNLEQIQEQNQDIQESDDKFDMDAIKMDLTDKITEQITSVIGSSALKSVLKDLNIKINISFEDK